MGQGDCLEAALAFASAGLAVFPVNEQKRPLVPSGYKAATTNESQIRSWWVEFPRAGIGVPTGHPNGLVVLDIDPRNGGNEAFISLVEKHGSFPATPTVLTGGGGLHYWFFSTKLVPSRKVCAGIDLKGDGGYVVAPPSPHLSGRHYNWKRPWGEVPPTDLPLWLLPPLKPTLGPGERSEECFTEGGRNAALTSLAGSMRRRNMHHDSILAALLSENETKCIPPLPAEEVEKIVASVSRYDADPIASPRNTGTHQIELSLLPLADLYTNNITATPWHVSGWLAERDLCILGGEGGSGKSLILLDLALALATLHKWFGLLSVEGGPYRVLYLDEENNAKLLRARLAQFLRAMEMPEKALRDIPLFPVSEQGVNLDNPTHLSALKRTMALVKPQWVFFDSLCRFHGREENSNSQMSAFFTDVLKPLILEFNCGIVALHHLNKPSIEGSAKPGHRLRGASDIFNMADGYWALEGDPHTNRRAFSHEKCRWDELQAPIQLTYHQSDDKQLAWLAAMGEAEGAEGVVLARLRLASPEPCSRSELEEALETAGFRGASRTLSRALLGLQAKNLVKKDMQGHRAFYALTPCAGRV